MSFLQERNQNWWWGIPAIWHNQTATHLRKERAENGYITISPHTSKLHIRSPKSCTRGTIFTLLCHCTRMLYNCSCKRSYRFSCMWEGKWCMILGIKLCRTGQKQLVRRIIWHYLCFTYPAHNRVVRPKPRSWVTFFYYFISVISWFLGLRIWWFSLWRK